MPSPGHASADAPGRGSGAFLVACSAIGIALVALCAWLAREEYFFGDDFLFLRQAQLPRDWVHVFFPLGQRAWWSYRPLSIEVYFSALHAVAGIDAFPYLLASLAAHFGAGVVVFRLAGRLALDRRVAIVAGLLSVALYPALNAELFWASTFQTVSGTPRRATSRPRARIATGAASTPSGGGRPRTRASSTSTPATAPRARPGARCPTRRSRR